MLIVAAAASVAALYGVGHWIAGLSVVVLFLVWVLVKPPEGPPILGLALTFQWTQVTCGMFYTALTGDELRAFSTRWDDMMLIGLGCVLLIALGARLGMGIGARWVTPEPAAPPAMFSDRTLYAAYAGSIAATGVMQEIAWQYPIFTQAILALNYSHLALTYLMLRSVAIPQFKAPLFAAVISFEVALGFTGYFAGFREPLIMGAIIIVEIFNTRDVRHWLLMTGLFVVLTLSSVMWISVRDQYRSDFDDELVESSRLERLERMQTLAEGSALTDTFRFRQSVAELADRMWTIYYPALALDRVPAALPHTDGTIIGSALRHLVTPRFLFPNKGELPSDSEMVRRYSGVQVAGADEGTSIAFGYAAEAYVDFGVPLMFVPVLLYGIFIGIAYWSCLFVLKHRDIAVAVTCVIFWLTVYLFERSWVKTLGLNLTLLVYLGGLTFLVDRFMLAPPAEDVGDVPAGASGAHGH